MGTTTKEPKLESTTSENSRNIFRKWYQNIARGMGTIDGARDAGMPTRYIQSHQIYKWANTAWFAKEVEIQKKKLYLQLPGETEKVSREQIKEDSLQFMHAVVQDKNVTDSVREKAAKDCLDFINREREIDSINDINAMLQKVDRLHELRRKITALKRGESITKPAKDNREETSVAGDDTASETKGVH
jgi:hypothetical protein